MRRIRFRFHLATVSSIGLVVALTSAGACRAPTQVTAEVFTDLPCDPAKPPHTLIRIGRLDGNLRLRPATVDTRTCLNQRVGSIVVVPSGSTDEEFAIEVLTSLGDTNACTDGHLDGCIVARRALHFVEHSSLDLPIDLDSNCLGKSCPFDQTCSNGECVSARIADPDACHGYGCRFVRQGPIDGGIPDARDGGEVGVDAFPSAGTWAKTFGPFGGSNLDVSGLAVAPDGSIYVALPFAGTTTLDRPLTSNGGDDVALVKYAPDGTVIWSRQLGSLGDDTAAALTVDSTGAVYLAGDTEDSGNFDAEGGVANTGAGGFYMVRYDASGARSWVQRRATSPGVWDFWTSLTIDGAGDLVYATTITEAISWDGTPRGSAPQDIVVARFATNDGSTKKVVTLGDPVGTQKLGGMVSTAEGPVIVGAFTGTLGTLTASTGHDGFVMGLDASFTQRWALSTKDTGAATGTDTDQWIDAIKVDSVGNLLVGGIVGATSFDMGGRSITGANTFLFDIDSKGGVISTKTFDVSYGFSYQIRLATGLSDTFAFYGTYYTSGPSTFSFEKGKGPLSSLGGNHDLALGQFTAGGVLTKQRVFGDAKEQEVGRVVILADGSLVITGTYVGHLDLGVAPGLPDAATQQSFVARVAP